MDTATQTNKKFLTVGETRALLGCSRQFIYDLVDQKKLPRYKIAKRTYFRQSDLESLFQQDHV